jgi:hypothetical protein
MGRTRIFTAIFLFLVLSGIGLAWVIYQQLEASALPNRPAVETAAVLGVPELPPLPEFSMAPLITFSAVLDRPVFSRSRRAPVEEVAVDSPIVSNVLELTLKGVIYSEGDRIALFAPKGSKDVLRLAEGSSYQGWELFVVEPSRVRFRRGDREEALALAFDTPPSVVPRQQKDRRRARGENNNRTRQKITHDEEDASTTN